MCGTFVNIGCGKSYHPDWKNFDLVPASPEVERLDARRGVPLPDLSCDAVYHSHILEHLVESDGKRFLSECYRLLKPGGILRVVVPDLEEICRQYIDALERAAGGEREGMHDHKWMYLELYDQAVRKRTGGKMRDYLSDPEIPNEKFVKKRCGAEVEGLIEAAGRQNNNASTNMLQKLREKPLRVILNKVRREITRGLVLVFGGKNELAAYDNGIFRSSGEIHLRMYDRVSIKTILEQVGFKDITIRSSTESAIPNFCKFELDAIAGKPRKPDSIFVEARK